MSGFRDDDLASFAAEGTPPLPEPLAQGFIDHDGARLWHATSGTGVPVILLHGGLGHAGNWSHQVPALAAAGRRVVLLDTRGHGRSTRDARPFHYATLADDLLAVMDALRLDSAAIVGWSDGACTGLLAALRAPERIAALCFFGCNVTPDGALPFTPTPTVDRCFARHAADFAHLKGDAEAFEPFVEAVGRMQRDEPDLSAADLARVAVPVTVVHAEHDEFIRPEHAAWIAATIPGARLVRLPEVSHFAPLQRPDAFDAMLRDFLAGGAR